MTFYIIGKIDLVLVHLEDEFDTTLETAVATPQQHAMMEWTKILRIGLTSGGTTTTIVWLRRVTFRP
jgi:hypothetical protein